VQYRNSSAFDPFLSKVPEQARTKPTAKVTAAWEGALRGEGHLRRAGAARWKRSHVRVLLDTGCDVIKHTPSGPSLVFVAPRLTAAFRPSCIPA
jgi:hypothetical protein